MGCCKTRCIDVTGQLAGIIPASLKKIYSELHSILIVTFVEQLQ